MAYFLGIDLGTTSTKAIVFSQSGAIQGMGNREYEVIVPQPTWTEQDPQAIFTAVIGATRDAVEAAGVAKDITAVGFGAATHSLMAIDSHNRPLTNSIIWADNRSATQAKKLKQSKIARDLYMRTGSPIHPVSPLCKLIWMREFDPETFRKAAKFVSVKEYIFYQLFEQYLVDYSIASATGLFNLKQLDWDEEAIALAEITKEQLSELVPTTYVLRSMKAEYAEAMGLAPQTPVVIGANDGALANLGVGAIVPGQYAITIGTSGAVRTITRQPVTDPQARTFCYALTESYWAIGGPTNNGGIVLRKLRDEFCAPEVEAAKRLGVDAYTVMIQAASEVPAGAEGLLCLPFLSGERAPYWNANARGVFFGVGLHHKRAHFIRAMLEGILFNVYSVRVALEQITGASGEILASGGFARSQIWRQMMADVFNSVVLMPETYEASGFGAAVLAMYAVGAIADLMDVQPIVQIRDRASPNLELSRTYHKLFALYERVYHNLVDEFDLLAELRDE